MVAPAANPLTPEPRHISIRLPRSLSIGLATIGLSLAAAVADGEETAEEAAPEQQVEIADATVYRWVFGGDSDAVSARRQLDTILRLNVSVVDRVCGLTDAQKQKLQLAGRGDITKLVHRIQRLERQYQSAKNDRIQVKALVSDAQALQSELKGGIRDDSSLFVKVLEKVLTNEQLPKYESLRAVLGMGGIARMQERGPDEALEINLNGTTLADDSLARVGELPCPQILALNDTRVTDAGLVHLKKMAKLEWLSLVNTQVSDAGVAHLRELTSLRYLRLTNTQVTDAALAHVKPLSQLKQLWLANTRVTDVGVGQLDGLTNLRELHLGNTRVTDAGLAHLKGLTELQRLGLGNTLVSDAGLAHLGGFSKLWMLLLDDTGVSDEGLIHLKGLAHLRLLYLRNTHVTDTGLLQLNGLTELRELQLKGTLVTARGVAELKRALPELVIAK